MKIETLNDLKKIILVCRKLGVDAIEIGDIKMSLGQEPRKVSKRSKAVPEDHIVVPAYTPGGITEEVKIPTSGGLTDEQLLFYSSDNHTPEVES